MQPAARNVSVNVEGIAYIRRARTRMPLTVMRQSLTSPSLIVPLGSDSA